MMTDGAKILVTALVTSLFTVGTVFFIEWVKARLQRGRVRKWLYREMLYNCGVLSAWVHSAKPHPEMQEHTAAQFASAYRKLAYEVAIKDAGFYSLRGDELYRIDEIYREFERISNGSYEEDCFHRAEVASVAVLLGVQDRLLSRGVVFSVSTARQKAYFREKLPRRFLYVNYDDAPPWREKVRQYSDAALYWFWRKRAAVLPSRFSVAELPGRQRNKGQWS
jgi:hypothetical protein